MEGRNKLRVERSGAGCKAWQTDVKAAACYQELPFEASSRHSYSYGLHKHTTARHNERATMRLSTATLVATLASAQAFRDTSPFLLFSSSSYALTPSLMSPTGMKAGRRSVKLTPVPDYRQTSRPKKIPFRQHRKSSPQLNIY